MPAVSTTPPTTISFAAMTFAVSREVTNNPAQVMNRQLMAGRSYTVADRRPRPRPGGDDDERGDRGVRPQPPARVPRVGPGTRRRHPGRFPSVARGAMDDARLRAGASV